MKKDDMPITMEDNPFDFDWVLGVIRNMLAGVGFAAMIVLIAFFYGYKS
jgi:hypothetical protein